MSDVITNLKPELVWKYFSEICQIPHVSGNEAQISDYVCNVATQLGLFFKKSECGNVLIVKPATSTPKNNNKTHKVLLQAHLDMVGVKTADSNHNFAVDPIETIITEDGFLKANNTTLGADDGIGVAMILALLEDNSIELPEIHALFTISEETDMVGANALTPDFVQADLGINIDSEDLGEICIGCAGGSSYDITLTSDIEAVDANEYKGISIEVSKGIGGHSGIEIDRPHINVATMLLNLMSTLYDNSIEARISDIKSGFVRNSIPSAGKMNIVVKTEYLEETIKLLTENTERLKAKYKETEKQIAISIDTLEATPTISLANTENIIALRKLNTKVLERTEDNTPLTSCNLGFIDFTDGNIVVKILARYATTSGKTLIENTIQNVVTETKSQITEYNSYPFWEPNYGSQILKVASKEYKKLTGLNSKVTVIHAGLECGIVKQQNQKLDIISVGPDVFNAHTPTEKVNIQSVEKCYRWIINTLEQL